MKNIATVALMLNLGVAGVYAQQRPVSGTFSGTAAASTISLSASAPTSEYQFAGNSSLGPFTFRTVSASVPAAQPPSTCPSPKIAGATVAGAGVFRFEDGSLLKVHLTQGSDCIDLSIFQALCIRTFQIIGGTGRLQGASGTVTLTETVVPVTVDATGNPALFAVTGELTGTISGAVMPRERQDEQQ
jgi:hypothetical protein